ncbi:hypothetical protein [Streptomyces sp. NBC_00094]|uniref:hypothetical protein n=1 Tax=Streptomyces sp. NBC_00094 TaxID=2903620 RepID=UPI00225946E6|nr:hypothetical protein [Streptomyces sp. NBC_00094]MCX5391140.1 hypothetical protein [Streptomyces sp. NBC_00094]
MTERKELRRPVAVGDLGGTVMLALFALWEAAGDDSAWWWRTMFGLLALWAVTRLVRVVVWRLRTRAHARA